MEYLLVLVLEEGSSAQGSHPAGAVRRQARSALRPARWARNFLLLFFKFFMNFLNFFCMVGVVVLEEGPARKRVVLTGQPGPSLSPCCCLQQAQAMDLAGQ
jgi:hypothetical protein